MLIMSLLKAFLMLETASSACLSKTCWSDLIRYWKTAWVGVALSRFSESLEKLLGITKTT